LRKYKKIINYCKKNNNFFSNLSFKKKEAGASFTKYLTIDYAKYSLVHGKYINNCTLYNKYVVLFFTF
jgi:hypothetical protein